ncbi:MAG: potassium transporter TrkG [Ardenticatenia bacterium]|nr:potassium transporter TrkG [Ardenticatenia bacterium]
MAEPVAQLAHPSPLAKQNALVLVVGFALIVAVGTLLLRLPISGTERPLTWEEALFISTSATTVTGLTVITPSQDLSPFGQLVLLVLMEVGGVGFIAFSVVLFALIGRRLGLAERMILKQALGVLETARIVSFTLYVLAVTMAVQAAGAFLLWLRWGPALGYKRAAYLAIFHAVSAFGNAGFDLFSGTGQVLFGFGRDPFTLSVMMVLILVGGLGILVISDLIMYPWQRRLSVHTKLTLVITAVLIGSGLLIVLADEYFAGSALKGLSLGERFWVVLFTVVSARTAGLTIIQLDQLSQASALVLMVSMFIGGAPASMAGGVTMSTVGVLMVAVLSTVRGVPQAVVFGRTLPLETIAKAVAIMTVSTLVNFFVTLLLLVDRTGDLFTVAFEVVSAFSNTGYSMGATADLDTFGRLLIAFTMFWGRLGPLTLVVLLTQRERPTLCRYPAEQIVLG